MAKDKTPPASDDGGMGAIFRKWGLGGVLLVTLAGSGAWGGIAIGAKAPAPPAGSAGYATREEVEAARKDCDGKVAEIRKAVDDVRESAAEMRATSKEMADTVRWLRDNLPIQRRDRSARPR